MLLPRDRTVHQPAPISGGDTTMPPPESTTATTTTSGRGPRRTTTPPPMLPSPQLHHRRCSRQSNAAIVANTTCIAATATASSPSHPSRSTITTTVPTMTDSLVTTTTISPPSSCSSLPPIKKSYRDCLQHIYHDTNDDRNRYDYDHHVPIPYHHRDVSSMAAARAMTTTPDADNDDGDHHDDIESSHRDSEPSSPRSLQRHSYYRHWANTMRYKMMGLCSHGFYRNVKNHDDNDDDNDHDNNDRLHPSSSSNKKCPRPYLLSYMFYDMYAGMMVCLMGVPQSLSYAKLAGLPVQYGLYASMIPTITYAIAGTSPYLIVGPVALISLLLQTGVTKAIQQQTQEEVNNNDDITILYVQYAIQTSLLVGFGMIFMGWCRMAKMMTLLLLPRPVISGFTTGAALTIATSQLKYILGYHAMPPHDTIFSMLYAYLMSYHQFRILPFLLGCGNIMMLVFCKRQTSSSHYLGWCRSLGPLIVTIVGIIIGATFQNHQVSSNSSTIPTVGPIPRGLPPLSIVYWQQSHASSSSYDWYRTTYSLLPTVVGIMIVGYMESYAMAQQLANRSQHEARNQQQQQPLPASSEYDRVVSTDADHPTHEENHHDNNGDCPEHHHHEVDHEEMELDANREMMALGLANVVGGMFSSYPVAGSLSRSAVNYEAGARSMISGIASSIGVVIATQSMTTILQYLPLCTLASIVITGVIPGLLDFRYAYHELYHYYYYAASSSDFIVWNIALIGTIFLGVEYGLLLAVLYNMGSLLYRLTYPTVYPLGRLPGTCHYRNIQQCHQSTTMPTTTKTGIVRSHRDPHDDDHNDAGAMTTISSISLSPPATLEQYPGMYIMKFDAPLCFANAQYVRQCVQSHPRRRRLRRHRLRTEVLPPTDAIEAAMISSSPESVSQPSRNEHPMVDRDITRQQPARRTVVMEDDDDVCRSLIIDMSSVSYIDTIGLHHLTIMVDDYYYRHMATCRSSDDDHHNGPTMMTLSSSSSSSSSLYLPICLVNPSEAVMQMLVVSSSKAKKTDDDTKCCLLSKVQLFPSVHDAVVHCLQRLSEIQPPLPP